MPIVYQLGRSSVTLKPGSVGENRISIPTVFDTVGAIVQNTTGRTAYIGEAPACVIHVEACPEGAFSSQYSLEQLTDSSVNFAGGPLDQLFQPNGCAFVEDIAMVLDEKSFQSAAERFGLATLIGNALFAMAGDLMALRNWCTNFPLTADMQAKLDTLTVPVAFARTIAASVLVIAPEKGLEFRFGVDNNGAVDPSNGPQIVDRIMKTGAWTAAIVSGEAATTRSVKMSTALVGPVNRIKDGEAIAALRVVGVGGFLGTSLRQVYDPADAVYMARPPAGVGAQTITKLPRPVRVQLSNWPGIVIPITIDQATVRAMVGVGLIKLADFDGFDPNTTGNVTYSIQEFYKSTTRYFGIGCFLAGSPIVESTDFQAALLNGAQNTASSGAAAQAAYQAAYQQYLVDLDDYNKKVRAGTIPATTPLPTPPAGPARTQTTPTIDYDFKAKRRPTFIPYVAGTHYVIKDPPDTVRDYLMDVILAKGVPRIDRGGVQMSGRGTFVPLGLLGSGLNAANAALTGA